MLATYNQQALDEDTVHYEEVLHHLEVKDFPDFHEMVRLKTEVFNELNVNEALDSRIEGRVSSNMEPIIKICKQFEYEPVIIEFSLILDERLVKDAQKRFFVSLLYFALKGGDIVKSRLAAATYAKAMNLMNTDIAQREPIIPHPKLYDPKYGCIVKKLRETTDNAPLEQGTSSISQAAPLYTAYQIPFIRHEGETDIEQQVNLFLNKLLESSSEVPEMSSSLSGLRFMIIPVVRPRKTGLFLPTGLRTAVKGTEWGVPAGCIFLFLRPPVDEKRDHYVELTRALRLMITRSCLYEMSYAFDDSLHKEALFGGMVHGTVNAIRSIGASELCKSISYKTPPETPADLNIRIFSKHEDKPDDDAAKYLISALNHAILGEDTAAMLLSFSEMQLSAGLIRMKFQNKLPISLDQVLTQALDLVNANAARSRTGNYAQVELVIDNAKSDSLKGELEKWVIPQHYLNAKIVRGLFSELLRNASQYGKRHGKKVIVTYNFQLVGDEELQIEFTNQTKKEGDKVDPETTTSGFLIRTQRALAGISGISLEFSRLPNNYYRSALILGKITAQLKGNGARGIMLIHQRERNLD